MRGGGGGRNEAERCGMEPINNRGLSLGLGCVPAANDQNDGIGGFNVGHRIFENIVEKQ